MAIAQIIWQNDRVINARGGNYCLQARVRILEIQGTQSQKRKIGPQSYILTLVYRSQQKILSLTLCVCPAGIPR